MPSSQEIKKEEESQPLAGFDWPPKMELAQLHSEANVIGNLDLNMNFRQHEIKEGKLELCSCCGLPKQTQKVPFMGTDINEVQPIGITTLLYFCFVKYMAFLLLVNFAVYGVYSFITNLVVQNLNSLYDIPSCIKVGKCTPVIIVGLSPKVEGDIPPTMLVVQAWLGLLLTLVWIVQLLYIRKQFHLLSLELDRRLVTPSDFTALLYNMPNQEDFSQEDVKAAIQKFYLSLHISNLKADIAKVNIAYEIEAYTAKLSEYEELRRQYRVVQIAEAAGREVELPAKEVEELKGKITELGSEIQKMTEDQEGQQLKPSLYAFVTFNTGANLQDFLKRTKKSLFTYYVLDPISKLLCCCFESFRQVLTFKGNYIITRRAPEPKDVNWENAGVDVFQVYKKKAVSWLVTFLLLGVSFAAIYGLSLAQVRAGGQLYLSLLVSLVIMAINAVLQELNVYVTRQEKAMTRSEYEQSLGVKIVLAQLMNSILVLVIVGYFIKQQERPSVSVFEKSGLVQDCFMLSLTTSLLPCVLALIVDVQQIKRAVMRCRYDSQIQAGECPLTQHELNKALEHSHFYISQEYATVCVIVLFNAFFSAMQPFVALFGCVGLLLLYQSKKCLLLKRYSRPEVFGRSVNDLMNSVVDFSPLLFSLGSAMCMNMFKHYSALLYPNLIGIGFSCVNIFFPLEFIFNYFLGEGDNFIQKQTYEEVRLKFLEEYDRSNPVTKDKAIHEYIDFLKKHTADKEEQKNLQNIQNNLIRPNKGRPGHPSQFLNNYMYPRPMPIYYPQYVYQQANYSSIPLPVVNNRQVAQMPVQMQMLQMPVMPGYSNVLRAPQYNRAGVQNFNNPFANPFIRR